MIGIGRILDVAPRGPRSTFGMFKFSMHELDDDGYVPNVVTFDFTYVKGATDYVDPPLYFDFMSRFVTRNDGMFAEYNNDMSVFKYSHVSLHFPMIASPTPTEQVHDIDDVEGSNRPLRGQLGYDSDSEEKKVTLVSSSTESVDFKTPNQPRKLKIGTSLSPDEMSRLIDFLRSYLDVFAWSYEDMPSLDPSIAQFHLPILPHARLVKQKLRKLHSRWSLQVKKEIQKKLSVGFLSVVEYSEWLANVVFAPKKNGNVRVCVDFRDLNKASPKDDFSLPHINMLVDSIAGHSFHGWFF